MRSDNGADTDDNANDFSELLPDPENTSDVDGNGPSIASVSNKSATVGQPITPFTVTATGGTAPYSWSATDLPAGLSINSTTGEVTGTPTTAGVSNVTVTAEGRHRRDGHRTIPFKITVNPGRHHRDRRDPGHRRHLADRGHHGHHSWHRDRRLPDWWLLRVRHPDSRHRRRQPRPRHAHRVRRGLRAAAHRGGDGSPGSYVEVTGTVAEFAGATQVEAAPVGIRVVDERVAPVVTRRRPPGPAPRPQKEVARGHALPPDRRLHGQQHVSTNNFGEVGLAQGTKPLIQRTEVERPGPAAFSATEADNLARAVVLDDGASTNFLLCGDAAACSPRPAGCRLTAT